MNPVNRRRVFLEKPSGLRQLVSKFAAVYGAGMYLPVDCRLLSNCVGRVDDEIRLD